MKFRTLSSNQYRAWLYSITTKAKDFSLQCRVQFHSRVHPSSCPMGNTGTFTRQVARASS